MIVSQMKTSSPNSKWDEFKLNDVTHKVTDGSHQSPKSDPDGLPMLSVKDMEDNGFNLDGSKKISFSDFENLVNQGCKPEINDILIAKDGSVLKHIFLVEDDINAVLLSSIAIIRPNKDKIDPKFLVFILKNPSFQYYILNNFLSGSGVPRIVLRDFKKIRFLAPGLKEQKAIANVLSAFDQKIALLQEQNKTLENLVQTLFKEWFGKYQVGDDLPVGWKVKKISELKLYITDLVANGSFASIKENVSTTDVKDYALFVRNTDLKDDFQTNKIYVDKHGYDFLKKSKLFGGEIIIANVSDIGSVHLCPNFNIPMTLGNNCIILRAENKKYWLYTYFKSRFGQHNLIASSIGSVQLKLSKTNFKKMEIVMPPDELLEKFEKIFESMYLKISNNKENIEALRNTRDSLLPKLMNGSIRIKEFNN